MKDLVKSTENKPQEVKEKVKLPNDYGKAFKWDLLIVALVIIVFGALFVTFPTDSLTVLCNVFGIGMCIWGVVSIITYFLSDKYALFNSYGLVRGIAFLALGIVVLSNNAAVSSLFISIFGALIIIDGALKLQYSVDMIRVKAKAWPALMIAAFAVIVLGGIVIYNPFNDDKSAQMFFTGISMIVDGVCDLGMIAYVYYVISKLKKGEDV